MSMQHIKQPSKFYDNDRILRRKACRGFHFSASFTSSSRNLTDIHADIFGIHMVISVDWIIRQMPSTFRFFHWIEDFVSHLYYGKPYFLSQIKICCINNCDGVPLLCALKDIDLVSPIFSKLIQVVIVLGTIFLYPLTPFRLKESTSELSAARYFILSSAGSQQLFYNQARRP